MSFGGFSWRRALGLSAGRQRAEALSCGIFNRALAVQSPWPDSLVAPAHADAALQRLAEQSVLALFVPGDDGHPARIGSCVLARLLGQPFVVTAGHVIQNIEGRTVHFAPRGRKLAQLANCRGYWSEPEAGGRDMGLIPLSRRHASLFDELVFLPSRDVEIEAEQQPFSPSDSYVVFGWPRSRSTFRLERPRRNIKQKSFTFHTGIATSGIAEREQLSPKSHLVLVFDPRRITVGGRLENPPNPDGISGGAAFRAVEGRLELAAIMTEHRKSSCVMVATRMSEFIAFAQDVIDSESAPGAPPTAS